MEIIIGMIGAGFAARLYGQSLKYVNHRSVRLKTVADIDINSAREVSCLYGYENYTDDYRKLLDDNEINLVIIATPPVKHMEITLEALYAGKHIICEKPLTGYFGRTTDLRPIGENVSKKAMYDSVIKDISVIREAVEKGKSRFMYAENYVYTPSIIKAAEIIKKKKSKIMHIIGEESVHGSPSKASSSWEDTGGGSLLRIGCHPLSGILHLKKIESESTGKRIGIRSVYADVSRISDSLNSKEKRHFSSKPKDVEDFAVMNITFTDCTKATVIAKDHVLGGVKNRIEVYCNDSTILCNITPNNEMQTYFLDQEGLEDVYISEGLKSKVGWNSVFVSEQVVRGYVNQIKDFLGCIIENREPISNVELASITTTAIYAGYCSAETGKNFEFIENPLML